jgi:hypothetical protein
MTVEFSIPIRTKPGLNEREHWRVRAARVKKERSATRVLMLSAWRRFHQVPPEPPWLVTLTRASPGTRPMDDDNLPGSLKAIRDEVASVLGVDDGDKARIRFAYAQERGEWGVRVRIERPQAPAPACGPDCDDISCRAHWRVG